jgi:hypothetical protein
VNGVFTLEYKPVPKRHLPAPRESLETGTKAVSGTTETNERFLAAFFYGKREPAPPRINLLRRLPGHAGGGIRWT